MEVEAQQSAPLEAEFIAAEDFPDELELRKITSSGSLAFDDWISLISEIENACSGNIEKLCLVYDSFLSEFPLCHGFWRKYADHKMRLCDADKVVDVFEQAVLSATYSVGVWVDYCQYAMSIFEDPDDTRRLFKRGISFVGKDYLCHELWDKYIEFEFSQQNWSSLANIYLQTLRFPSKKLQHYYDSFKKLASIWEEEIKCQSSSAMESRAEAEVFTEVNKSYGDGGISNVIKELQDNSDVRTRSTALQKYKFIGEKFYKDSCLLNEKISSFESDIHRSYFHVKQLKVNQLENWHKYLDFVEKQEDFDWVVKLYERCLIPAAYYPEFWMRYVECMENKGGRELANFALDRATRIFLKNMPVIHVYNSRYKEQIGDPVGARASLLHFRPKSDTDYVESVVMKANMEKRCGNSVAASDMYREAIDKAKSDKKLDLLPSLYIHYSQHLYVTTKSEVAARDILIDAIEQLPNCKLLYEELLKFVTMHGGPEHIDVVGRVIMTTFSSIPGEIEVLNARDLEHISNLFLRYVDFCGTISNVRKAWNRHMKMFPHLLRTTFVRRSPDIGTERISKISINGEVTHHHPSGDLISEIQTLDPIREKEPPSSMQRCIDTDFDKAEIAEESSGHAQKASSKPSLENSPEQQEEPYGEQSPNEAEPAVAQAPQKDTVQSEKDGIHDHELNPHSLAALSLKDPDSGSKTSAETSNQGYDGDQRVNRRREHYYNNPTEPHSKGWWDQQTDNSGRPTRRDPRFRSNGGGGGGHLRRRSQYQVQVQPMIQPRSEADNQNYNFALQAQLAAQSTAYPQIQSGEISNSSEAYSLQMWQYYYYYYQQQQVVIQQQLQQLQVTQSQLQQQQQQQQEEEQKLQYQQVLQQIYQLQQQQQQLYQHQQQLYQQYQQQLYQQQQEPYSDEQCLSQEQLLYIQQQQQLFYQQQQLLEQTNQVQGQQSQELQLQSVEEGEPTDKKKGVEEISRLES